MNIAALIRKKKEEFTQLQHSNKVSTATKNLEADRKKAERELELAKINKERLQYQNAQSRAETVNKSAGKNNRAAAFGKGLAKVMNSGKQQGGGLQFRGGGSPFNSPGKSKGGSPFSSGFSGFNTSPTTKPTVKKKGGKRITIYVK